MKLIEDIGLSVRAYNCLKNAGVNTIEEMTQVNTKKIKFCGKKTQMEINNKILELIDKGLYTQEFIAKHFFKKEPNFVNSLPLSERSKNVLKALSVDSANKMLLLTEDTLANTRNSGSKTVNEILSYIKNNYNNLLETSLKNNSYKVHYPIQYLSTFSGNTLLSELNISYNLCEYLKTINIYNILDLLEKKQELPSNFKYEYECLYNYFYNIVYNPLKIKINKGIGNLYVYLPFKLAIYNEKDYVNIGKIIKYAMTNFTSFTKIEKIHIKLYFYWLSFLEIPNYKSYILDNISLNDKQIKILAKRDYSTLEELGQYFGLTRERIRQLESKAVSKIKRKYLTLPFRFLDNHQIYYIDNLDDFTALLLHLDTLFDHNFIFVKNYYLPTIVINKLNNLLTEKSNELKYNGFLEISNIDKNDLFYKSIDYLNLGVNNNYIFKKVNKRKYIKYAMRYLGRPISLSNEQDLDDLIKTANMLFGEKFAKGRALEAIINDAGVRVDSGTYSDSDKVIPLSQDMLYSIETYVKSKKIINTRDLFAKYGDELLQHNINNEFILYRYLKDNLNGKLFFHGVSAVISSEPDLDSWGGVVIRDIKTTGKPINKMDLMIKYSISEAVYANLPVNFNDIIFWGNKELYLKSLIKIDEAILNKFKDYIDKNVALSFRDAKNYLLSLNSNILIDNNVNSNDNIYYFFKNILDENYIVNRDIEKIILKRKKRQENIEEYSKTTELTI